MMILLNILMDLITRGFVLTHLKSQCRQIFLTFFVYYWRYVRCRLPSPLRLLSFEGCPGAPCGRLCASSTFARVWGSTKGPRRKVQMQGIRAGVSPAAAGRNGQGGGWLVGAHWEDPSPQPPAHTSGSSYCWGQCSLTPLGFLHPASPGPSGKCSSGPPSCRGAPRGVDHTPLALTSPPQWDVQLAPPFSEPTGSPRGPPPHFRSGAPCWLQGLHTLPTRSPRALLPAFPGSQGSSPLAPGLGGHMAGGLPETWF